MSVSVIIPTLNEASNIEKLIQFLIKEQAGYIKEIIVVDCGSTDQTSDLAKAAGALVFHSKTASRAAQLNLGADKASGDILYFVHADTRPPKKYDLIITDAITTGIHAGCFRYQFDSRSLLLAINSWFTQFSFIWCQGGDKTLFISAELFRQTSGFNEKYVIMEDYEYIERIKEITQFKTLKQKALVSARKYKKNSWLRVQIANLIAFKKFNKGEDPNDIKYFYNKFIYK